MVKSKPFELFSTILMQIVVIWLISNDWAKPQRLGAAVPALPPTSPAMPRRKEHARPDPRPVHGGPVYRSHKPPGMQGMKRPPHWGSEETLVRATPVPHPAPPCPTVLLWPCLWFMLLQCPTLHHPAPPSSGRVWLAVTQPEPPPVLTLYSGFRQGGCCRLRAPPAEHGGPSG